MHRKKVTHHKGGVMSGKKGESKGEGASPKKLAEEHKGGHKLPKGGNMKSKGHGLAHSKSPVKKY